MVWNSFGILQCDTCVIQSKAAKGWKGCIFKWKKNERSKINISYWDLYESKNNAKLIWMSIFSWKPSFKNKSFCRFLQKKTFSKATFSSFPVDHPFYFWINFASSSTSVPNLHFSKSASSHTSPLLEAWCLLHFFVYQPWEMKQRREKRSLVAFVAALSAFCV